MKTLAALFILAALITLPFQNCGSGFKSMKTQTFSVLEAVDINCMTNTNHDACIYYKNPVAHFEFLKLNVLIDQMLEMTSLQTNQNYAVNLEGLADTNSLVSSDFTVYDSAGTPAMSSTGWHLEYTAANAAKIGQVSSYFYAQKVNRFYLNLGKTYLYNKNIRIVTDTNGNGWSSAGKTIYLTTTQGRNNSLDASTVVHLANEAAISFATSAAIYQMTGDTKHVDCGPQAGPVYAKDCCASKLGCSKAITSGLSDYMVAVMFPDYPIVGEYVSRSPAGESICSSLRDLNASSAQTADAAYSVCAANSRAGQVFVMGNFYGSIWWTIRQKIIAANSKALTSFDKLYAELLPQLATADDFSTVLAKVKALDVAKFGSAYSTYFNDEYIRRGLPLN